jgi:trans-aconitate 2-methyltransferase
VPQSASGRYAPAVFEVTICHLKRRRRYAVRVAWDPAQYLKFADHRLRPAIDLLSRIEAPDPGEVYDLGAGAGNVTRLLKARWPTARITGVDSSLEMLAKAAAAAPEIAWRHADLATWRPEQPADVIYSNAALHWLGDHDRMFRSLIEALAPGGTLAVQMPRNFLAPSHTSMADAARRGPWRSKLEPLLRPVPVSEPAFYYDALATRAASLDIWETEYLQVLEGEHPVKEWTKGTWLKPLLDALEEPERSGFEAAYAELVARAYPRRADGRTLLPFRRLFIVARARG